MCFCSLGAVSWTAQPLQQWQWRLVLYVTERHPLEAEVTRRDAAEDLLYQGPHFKVTNHHSVNCFYWRTINVWRNKKEHFQFRYITRIVFFWTFWHVYVLVGAYFVWPWKSRKPSVTLTSHRGHWPLLIRVSGITWRGSKLIEKLSFIRVT
jgi:hypothetical protein